MKMKKIILSLLTIFLLVALMGCSEEESEGIMQVKPNNNKYVDVYDVVKNAFTTDNGYTDEIEKHMSKEVFDRTNIYKAYNVNDPKFKRPFKVEFILKEVAQNKEKEKIIVHMNYSVDIIDASNKSVGGSRNVPIEFTVERKNGNWYIIKKEEAA